MEISPILVSCCDYWLLDHAQSEDVRVHTRRTLDQHGDPVVLFPAFSPTLRLEGGEYSQLLRPLGNTEEDVPFWWSQV